MATGFSRYRRQAHLTSLIGQILWLSFHSADPGDQGANELGDAGYVRWPVLIADWGSASLATPSLAANDTLITIGPVSGDYNAGSAISYACLWSNETSTSEEYCEFITELETPLTILDGTTKNISMGNLSISHNMAT